MSKDLFTILRDVDSLTKKELGELLGIAVWGHFAEPRYYEKIGLDYTFGLRSTRDNDYNRIPACGFNYRHEAEDRIKSNKLKDCKITVHMSVINTGTCWNSIMISSDYSIYPFGGTDEKETQAHSNSHVAYVAKLIELGCVKINLSENPDLLKP
jgi:hypothetical protein